MSGYFTTDPYEMENRFSNEDSFAFMENLFVEPTDQDLHTISRIKDVLDFIPQWEADLIEMFFFRQMRQTDIAHIFKVSQPTVCYRLQRAAMRIQFILNVPPISEDDLMQDIRDSGADEFDAQVIYYMVKTTCQSEAALQIGSTQSMVRHRFLQFILRLDENHPCTEKYKKLLEMIRDNSNILRDVSRRSFDHRIAYMIIP